ncbi:hypothetical protein [Streptomyces albidochromogenes]|uniref:Lipoprotein n=1 Tax=Streptomyces albidochromogenes TaxID=329524 RepID=A0ABW6FK96_9ACTN
MGRQLWRPIVIMGAVGTLTVSCGLAAVIHAAEVSTDQVAGRWTSDGGTSLTFHEDHAFTAEDFDELAVSSGCENPSALSSGLWAFPAEGSPLITPDETVTRGTVLSLTFSASECEVTAYLFGDEDDPVLCPTDDADVGCPMDDYLHRNQTTALDS